MQRGFASINIFIILTLASTLGVIVYLSFKPQTVLNGLQNIANPDTNSDCTLPIQFTNHFTDVNAVSSITPPVFRNSKGIMPTTLINTTGKVPLYLPVSGKLSQGSYYTEQGTEFYMFEINVGCGVTVVFDHVTEPIEKIKSLFPETPDNDSRSDNPYFASPFDMQGGELVGYTTGTVYAHNWNFAVYDSSQRNYLWGREDLKEFPKYYTQVCPFNFYDPSMAKDYEDKFILFSNDISVEKNLCEN